MSMYGRFTLLYFYNDDLTETSKLIKFDNLPQVGKFFRYGYKTPNYPIDTFIDMPILVKRVTNGYIIHTNHAHYFLKPLATLDGELPI